MPNYRRAYIQGGIYFFTVNTYQRRPILLKPEIRLALHEAISSTRQLHPFSVHAWVLLPDHMHCMWRLPTDDPDFSKRWAMIKRHVSKHCGQVFQRCRENDPIQI